MWTLLTWISAFLIVLVWICTIVGLVKPGLVKAKNRLHVVAAFFVYNIVFFMIGGFAVSKDKPDHDGELVYSAAVKKSTKPSITYKLQPVKSYRIIGDDDISFAGRDRFILIIVSPEAKNIEERVATSKAAAISFLKQKHANFVSVLLMPTPNAYEYGGMPLAVTDYAPDGCGTSGENCTGKKWDIQASNINFSKQQLEMLNFWFSHKKEYYNADGFLDLKGEKKLKIRISNEFNIPVKDVQDFNMMINLQRVNA
ncbi:TPA: DUF4875 domain-containing protein [Salmonella enterica]|nr:DUF4875 domain-containing protein [Salmonella enterica subsp. enterica serovar Newport]ECD9353654.1 DUF4875 domain-containing protein [Salmonella enterica subsp. salamae]ECY4825689.1 DUF4875 domain-containing protein [Salmonella enterica subsp. enterica serovar Lindern]EDG9409180.1 DUF4875 domain-containing protein [Salmonella enterica subsp. enterica serovar Tennessee]EEE9158932.1 DUF4875 domain-containing protein [Salmonella enterica subsp. enterica serovar Kimberley]EJI7101030.1 DUF4875 